MKSSTVWRGHSTQPSLPAGTARKAKENLLRGRRNKLILQVKKKSRKFPLGNSLVYILLLSVAFGRVRPSGAPCFCVFRPLVRDFQTCYSYILSSHDGSLRRLSPHMPENQIQFARRTIHWTLTWMDFQMQIFWCLGKSTYQFAAPMLLGLAIAGDFPDPLDFCANAQIPIWFYVAMNFWQSYFHCSRWQHPLLILDIPLSNLLLCYGIVYICTS